jgi:hypothetical protein
MNITDIDPIEHKLYFERFIDVGALDLLNEGKITRKELKIPDVDLDFGTHDREVVIKSLVDTYGFEFVACIGRFNYNKSKGTLTDIGRALKIPFDELKNITKSLGEYELDDIFDLIEQSKTAKTKPEIVKKFEGYIAHYPELFEISKMLIGLPSSFGLHPCFTEDALVLTDNGYKNINKISVGDKVITHDNNYQLVNDVIISRSSDIYKVNIMGVPTIAATGNHPFYVRKMTRQRYVNDNGVSTSKKLYGNPQWISVEELDKNCWIGMAINQNSIIPVYENLPTNNKDFWWIVGRYMGDGWYEEVKNRNEKRLIICCNKNNNEI